MNPAKIIYPKKDSLISGDEFLLIHRSEYTRLAELEERIKMKLKQLENNEDFVCSNLPTRQSYIKALQWALGSQCE
jgi:hypothetical protein